MMRGQQDQQSRMFYELSTLVLNMLRSPPSPISFSDHPPPPPVVRRSSSPSLTQISPAGFASLLLGISVALMLCGSVTFFIGFFLMPWVFGLVMVLYVAGIVSTLSTLGRSILCYATTPRKEIPVLPQAIGGFMMKIAEEMEYYMQQLQQESWTTYGVY